MPKFEGSYREMAFDMTKKGGDLERAQVLALLAISESIDNLADELRGMGTELHPINTYEQNNA